MERRFYCGDIALDAQEATLRGDEAQHLTRVLRARVGEAVVLFDGRGHEFEATVERLGRSEVVLQVQSRTAVDRELPFTLHLGVALPKGERQRWLVEKAVELGVTGLTPLATHRGVAQPTTAALERLRRYVIEASKQCGRNRLLEISEPQTLLEYATAVTPQATRLVAHPATEETPRPLRDRVRPSSAGLYLLIGPEGGLTDEELDHARAAGWHTVDLGRRILRIETAALLLVALAATTEVQQPPLAAAE